MDDREILILDVTRMRENRVCIAGIGDHLSVKPEDVRPVPQRGQLERDFLKRTGIVPFSIVRFRFAGNVPIPPHVEDYVFNHAKSGDAHVAGALAPSMRQCVLDSISKNTLGEIFGENLVSNKFIYESDAGRSLGCLKIEKIHDFYINTRKDGESEKLSLRVSFRHGGEKVFLPVVDLNLYDRLCDRAARNETEAFKKELINKVKTAKQTYIRVGLARPHRFPDDKDEDPRGKCYVQVIGIHTFPNPL